MSTCDVTCRVGGEFCSAIAAELRDEENSAPDSTTTFPGQLKTEEPLVDVQDLEIDATTPSSEETTTTESTATSPGQLNAEEVQANVHDAKTDTTTPSSE